MHSTIKLVSLSALCILMTALTIVMHISRTHRDPKTPPYNPAAAVLLTEIGKLLCAICLSVREVKQLLLQEAEDEYGGGMSAHGAGDQHDDVFASRSRSRSRSKSNSSSVKDGRQTLFDVHSKNKGLWMTLEKPEPADGNNDHDDADSAVTLMSRQTSTGSGVSSSSSTAFSSLTLSSDSLHDQTRFLHHTAPPQATPSIPILTILQRIRDETVSHGWLKLSIPAFLFTAQANLAYYASSRLSVPVFQVTYQLKIPATALCTVVMLKRTLSRMQWLAIVLLTFGVATVQLASFDADKTHSHSASMNSKEDAAGGTASISGSGSGSDQAQTIPGLTTPEMTQMYGLLAVCLACLSSGFSGVYFERVLKAAPASTEATASAPPRKTGLWIRNIQLSLFSLVISAVLYLCTSSPSPPTSFSTAAGPLPSSSVLFGHFLTGFTPIVYFLVLLQIIGGLLAAVVIQYADNIAKSFSASCSIILSFLASIILFNYTLSLGVVIGGAAVIASTWLFNAAAAGDKLRVPQNRLSIPSDSRLPISPKPAHAEYVPLRQS